MLHFLDTFSVLPLAAISILIYWITLAVYRLFFHKLSAFPGPKLAALSKWYEFYFDVYLGGKFVFKLDELHKQYGPVVRITPDEIHVSDPDFFNEYFARQGPQSRYTWMANRFNNETSTFSAVGPELHRSRRAALETMFSRQQVRQLLPMLQENTSKMLSKFSEYQESGKPMRLDRALFALSEDMIFEYGFGISHNALDFPKFEGILHETFVAAGSAGALSLQFPIVPKIMNALPDWVILKLEPKFLPMIRMRREFVHEFEALQNPEKVKSRKVRTHRTVMLDLLSNTTLPPQERTKQRMLDEAQLIIGGGLTTTGWAATVGLYHILTRPSILQKVRAELFELVPAGEKRRDCADLDWAKLEGLPYFSACIKESLRLSYGLSSRDARLTPKEVIYTPSDHNTHSKARAKSWKIPENTPVSMSIPIVNHNEDVFPDSWAFKPERWLGPDKVPDKYFVSFGKGPRQCLGMQLAWAELNLMFASVIRWFDLELYETAEKAVCMHTDVIIPIPEGHAGVRILVKAELD